jgi:type IV pilus assembly protein PilM
MARRSRTIVGLDIEPGALAAAQVKLDAGLTVERAVAADLEPHVVRDGEVADAEGLTEALKRLWAEHGWLGKKVRIGVANARIVVRTLDLPPIEDRAQLEAAVRFQAADELPMPLEHAVLDFHPLGLVDTPDGGRRARVVLVAARRDMVERVLVAARAAGLRPEGIDLAAFAMSRALAQGDPRPTVFLNVGGLTNLAVARGGVCTFTRVAGGGLEAMAVELAERHGLTLERARGWLAHVGLERDPQDVGGEPELVASARRVLTDGVRRVSGEVRASLDFHQLQQTGGPAVEQVVVTGVAAAIPGFAGALQVEIGLPVAVRTVPAAGPEALAGLAPERISVAAGLAVEEVPLP